MLMLTVNRLFWALLFSLFVSPAFSQKLYRAEVYKLQPENKSIIFWRGGTDPTTQEVYLTNKDWTRFSRILKRKDVVLFSAYECSTLEKILTVTREEIVYSAQ